MLPIPNSIAFTIFGFQIHWYALCIVSGILAGYFLVRSRLKRWNLSDETLLDFLIIVLPFSVIGARAYYVFFSWDYYGKHPEDIFSIWKGGLAIHGAILAALIVAFLFCRVKHIHFFKFCDLCVPGLALGQAIGRWGNYFNMEAHGRITDVPWAIPILENGKLFFVHPTFLYESIWDLGIVFFLLWFERREKKFGEGLCVYLMLYSVGRFFIESMRTDPLLFLGLHQAQLISVVLFFIGAGLFFWLRSHGQTQNLYIN